MSALVGVNALVLGRGGLMRDVTVHVLASYEARVVMRADESETSAASVAVLVDPDSRHWDVAERLGLPVVLITPDDVSDARVLAAILRGAEAVLHTDVRPARLVEAVEIVHRGGTLLDPRHTKALAEAARTRLAPRRADTPPPLTRREAEIVVSIDRGDSVKQTARALQISVKTVENLQGRLFRKLGVRNRAQAVGWAYTIGVLPTANRPRNALPL